jgi:hypothetical protein
VRGFAHAIEDVVPGPGRLLMNSVALSYQRAWRLTLALHVMARLVRAIRSNILRRRMARTKPAPAKARGRGHDVKRAAPCVNG